MTQKELILQYITDFGSITSYLAYADLGITQLATRVSELKDKGYVFKTELQTGKNRYGKPTHYVKYYLENGVC